MNPGRACWMTWAAISRPESGNTSRRTWLDLGEESAGLREELADSRAREAVLREVIRENCMRMGAEAEAQGD
eukprot:1570551-Prymnesium_polylepis.1